MSSLRRKDQIRMNKYVSGCFVVTHCRFPFRFPLGIAWGAWGAAEFCLESARQGPACDDDIVFVCICDILCLVV